MKKSNLTLLTILLLTANFTQINASEMSHQNISNNQMKKIAASWTAIRTNPEYTHNPSNIRQPKPSYTPYSTGRDKKILVVIIAPKLDSINPKKTE